MLLNRALEIGISLSDLDNLSIGNIIDILTQRRNEEYESKINCNKKYATTEDVIGF